MSDEAVSQNVMVHSLAISPDLHALLADDERTRSSSTQPDSTQSLLFFQTPVPDSFDTVVPASLPPPPRSRKGRSQPTIPKKPESVDLRATQLPDVSEHFRGSSSSLPSVAAASNPSIYVPPKLPISQVSDERERRDSAISDMSSPLEMPLSLRKALDRLVDISPSATAPEQSSNFFHSHRSHASVTEERSASLRPTDQPFNPPIVVTHSKSRLETSIRHGKSMVLTSDSHSHGNSQSVLDEEVPDSPGLNCLSDRGVLGSFSEYANQPGPSTFGPGFTMHQTVYHDQNQRHHIPSGNEGGDEVITPLTIASSSSQLNEDCDKPSRSTLSHGSHIWESSHSRSDSYSSECAYSPTAASEPRISISSTRYSSESLRQLSQISDPASRFSSNSLSFASPDHDSFIDLFSSSPDFATLPDHSPLANVSRPTLSTLKHSGAVSRPFFNEQSPTSSSPSMTSLAHTTLHLPKPPVPTTPKPNFKKYSITHPPPGKNQHKISSSPMYRLSRQASPKRTQESQGAVLPTTNFLNADERADLVKKSRKLAQVFGTTPKASVISQKHGELQSDSMVPSSVLPVGLGKGRHVHGAVSVSETFNALSHNNVSESTGPLPESIQYMTTSRRRHSTTVSHENIPFLCDTTTSGDPDSGIIEIGPRLGVADSDWSSNRASDRNGPDSPTSFMDLSDEDVSYDGMSAMGTTKMSNRGPDLLLPPLMPIIAQTLTPGEQEEVDRKRKRDKLAKLHRYLGSRVPVGLVLGESLTQSNLRDQDGRASKLDNLFEHGDYPKAWLTRRRSSSAAVYSDRSQGLERLKEDLNEVEKAIYVRRAQKMERVFGVPPPQTLYTRHSASLPSPVGPSSGRVINFAVARSNPPSPVSRERNPNQSAYKVKKRHDRPGTSESSQRLIPARTSGHSDLDSQGPNLLAIPDVYSHYQHSLHSLNDIIDRDDRTSLVELHRYLQGEPPSSPLLEFAPASSSPSIKSERRRSLPSSIMSVSTADYNMPALKPESTDFQLRRRRAAKLTQFFGVDYKQIIHDVLESIEKGVEEERKRGTLQPEEVEALLCELRTLKTKRSGIL